MITIENLSKSFGSLTVFTNVNVEINKGECIALIGPSGTGKSVFLRTIAMLEKPDGGSIQINGIDITQKGVDLNKVREKMGMVYQGFHLFSHLNVIDNITLAPRKVKKENRTTAEKRGMELLYMVGLTDKALSYPSQLSGGQQQRIAIARCLAMNPEIILFDEPTSALDPSMTGEVLAIIRKLKQIEGLTMLIVTHEMGFAEDVSNRVWYMDEGGIYEEGTPFDIFKNPQKERTRAFIRKLKLFNYEIRSKGFDMIDMNVKIELFCQKYFIETKKVYHIQLLLEELLVEIIKCCYEKKSPEINFTIEYSEEKNEITISFNYKGEYFNPFETTNTSEGNLGIMLVNKISKKTDHRYEGGQNTININL